MITIDNETDTLSYNCSTCKEEWSTVLSDFEDEDGIITHDGLCPFCGSDWSFAVSEIYQNEENKLSRIKEILHYSWNRMCENLKLN